MSVRCERVEQPQVHSFDYFFEPRMQMDDTVVPFRPIADAPRSRSGRTCWLTSLCTAVTAWQPLPGGSGQKSPDESTCRWLPTILISTWISWGEISLQGTRILLFVWFKYLASFGEAVFR